MGSEKGFAAIGAAIGRMYVSGSLSRDEFAELAVALKQQVDPVSAAFNPAIAELSDKLSLNAS